MNSDDQPELGIIAFWSVKLERLPKQGPPTPFFCDCVAPPKVLTWLLSAEDGLQSQPPVSSSVEEVKEQFHTHEVSPLED